VAAGLLLLFLPTFYDAARSFWQTDENGHAPLILAVVLWLIWQQREPLLFVDPSQRRPAAGIAVLLFGLLLYVVGRSQQIAIFEIGALIPVLAGVLLAMHGTRALRAMWFPLLFIVFMLPLPGFLVDALTGPLKHQVSRLVEALLYWFGYPVARDGVTLVVGPYQLLVADACSGMHTMFSLSALGVLFMYLKGRASVVHNAIMLVSILPVAFAANIVRVLLVALITFHFGDEAGQGYLHGAAGIVLMTAALIFLFLIDAVLARVGHARNPNAYA
jgi:exosortase B